MKIQETLFSQIKSTSGSYVCKLLSWKYTLCHYKKTHFCIFQRNRPQTYYNFILLVNKNIVKVLHSLWDQRNTYKKCPLAFTWNFSPK